MIAGIPPLRPLLVGMCNAVGGGLLRDVLVREEPLVFKAGASSTRSPRWAAAHCSSRCPTTPGRHQYLGLDLDCR